MKKLLLPISLLILGMMPAAAQKINPKGRIILEEIRMSRTDPSMQSTLSVKPGEQVRALITLNPGYGPSALTSTGFVEVTAVLGDICVAVFPIELAEKVADLQEVKSVSFGDELRPTLDFARLSGKVDEVQNGFTYNGQTVSFDGTGVVLGMMDIGLEPNHVNFKNSDGSTRIQRAWHFKGQDGTDVTEYTASNMRSFTTDTEKETHGTHVAGIMAGGYKGTGTVAYLNVPEKPASGQFTSKEFQLGPMNVPYYGVATNSDLALAVGSLYDSNIIQAVSNIITYAESQNKPVVVNLSLGSNSGPHDGTDNYSRALSELGKRGIIVMAAGNEGDQDISIKKTLGSSGNDAYLRTFPYAPTVDKVVLPISGIVDLWGTDNSVITLSIGLYSTSTKKFTPAVTVNQSATSGNTQNSSAFKAEYDGTISVESGVDPNNNRYRVYMKFNGVSRKSTAKQYIAIEATGRSGNTLYLYGNDEALFSNRAGGNSSTVIGYTKGSPANSISDACCGANIISVGSYNTRNVWGVFNENDKGGIYGFNGSFPLGEISGFSSYGTSFQGTKLPLVCAPGAGIVSSVNRYNVAAEGSEILMSAKAANGVFTDYWGELQGTSMACPFVTGTVGLWLQADPALTFAQVLETINKSSVAQATAPERWGAGKIDALAGIKYVLDKKAAIGSVFEDEDQRLVLTPGSGSCNVYVAGASHMTLSLVDLQGRALRTIEVSGDNADISTDGLTGIYVVEAVTDLGRFARKAVLR